MKQRWSSAPSVFSRCLLVATLPLLIGIATSCGSSGSTTIPKLKGNTSLSILLSSTGNDQVTSFDLQMQTLTLTSKSGKTVTLLSSQQPSEFIHLNGWVEPLATVIVPQDIYTSATATVAGAVFVCIAQVPGGGLGFANYSVVNQGPTVTLAAPITVTGSNMTLLLNMQVSSSAVFPSCWTTPPFQGFSLAPTFSLTPYFLSASPTNSGNGKVGGLKAQLASLGASSNLTLTVPGGYTGTRSLSATYSSSTVFQGISGPSALAAGMFLDVDGAIQPDGSLLATRIAVENPSAINESSGPLIMVGSVVPVLLQYGRTQMGTLASFNGSSGHYFDTPYFDFSNSTFSISGQMTNLQNLPFVPSFNASTMVAGQNVDITSPDFILSGGAYTPANTITLVPQTINGTVLASQQAGSFVDFTVSLAAYDLFPTLAAQQGQTTVLTNPSQIEVYVDSNSQKLNKQALAPGSTLRFYGLVFNDNGTLRMDCAEVNDGVALSSASANAASSGVRQPASFQMLRLPGAGPAIIGRTMGSK